MFYFDETRFIYVNFELRAFSYFWFSRRSFSSLSGFLESTPNVTDTRSKRLAQGIRGRFRRDEADRPTNPSPSAYGEWPGRINRKAGISFRRCGSAVPRLAVAVSFELRRCQWQLCSRATYWTHVQSRSFIPTYLALLCPPLFLSLSLFLTLTLPSLIPIASSRTTLLLSFSPFSRPVPSISISSPRLIFRPKVRPQPTSQIIVHVMGHAHRIEPSGNNKVEGGLSRLIYGD